MTALESHLKGDRAAPPPLDQRECRFGMWLDADGLASYGAQPAAAAIRPLHQQIHVLATAVCDLHTQDRTSEALTRLGELHDLQDALLEHLKSLVRDGMHPSSASG
ncbi:MAG: CZB domain-containing protein [Lamprocystis purpurea]|nr:CZB domain-containing protein [Lamprocystis purpurea]